MPDDAQTPPPEPPPPGGRVRAGEMLAVSSELTGPVLLGVALDALAGTGPWGVVGGVLLGLAVCMAHLYRITQRLSKS